jgi:predicted ribosomally synthesized peptide with SipW-like signal peptide
MQVSHFLQGGAKAAMAGERDLASLKLPLGPPIAATTYIVQTNDPTSFKRMAPMAFSTGYRQESRRLRSKLLATAVLLGLIGIVAGLATWSAFSATTSNPGNSFAAGTVTITDNDSGTAMFSLSGMKPNDADTGCITVTYTGSLASTVRLYGTTTGTGLDQYLNLKVTRGSFSSPPAFDSCTGFTADATDYIAAGAGVIYNGTLQGYADSYAAGLVDPTSGSPESWTTSEAHVYKFEVTLQNDNAAQGLNATQTFTWEAQSS